MPEDWVRTIGFVGLGAMGTPMSSRLVGADYDVVGFDVGDEARSRASAQGVKCVERLEDVARGVDVLILMLPDSTVVESVLSDPGLLAVLEEGTVIIDMSSSEPLRTRELARRFSSMGHSLIDAPVSGGVKGAQRGSLTVMVGAETALYERCASFLGTFGRAVHAGPVGAGHAIKALNNLLSATHLLVTSEAMLAGEKFGLDPTVMLEIFNGSSGRSGSTENKWPNFILPGTFDSGFGLRLMLKDMKIAVQLANQVGVPCELGRGAVELWREAAEGLDPGADHTEIARWLSDAGAANGP